MQGQRSAGAVTLADDSLRRREVALIAGRDDREGLELLSPLHYLQAGAGADAPICWRARCWTCCRPTRM